MPFLKSVVEPHHRGFAFCKSGALASIFLTSSVYADVGCRADLSYSWKKQGAQEVLEVLHKTIEAVGATEEFTRQELNQFLLRERSKVVEACRERHENVAGCVGTRFAQNQPAMANMPFTARKALEDAIKADCQALQGVCGVTKVGEVSCAPRVVVATATPAAEAVKEEKGKEKEGKKK